MINSNLLTVNKIKIAFLMIFFIGLGIRFFYFPFDLPLVIDGMDNFTYATAINYYGHLPKEWAPANNGWPMFLSMWFSVFSLENTQQYMDLQRIISIILSCLIAIPVYFLCKKFFDERLALVGAALFSFDPRIILNSLLGITEPLFILLAASSLVLFLTYRRTEIIVSFALASLCTIVRSEGIFLFFTLTMLFFIRHRSSRDLFKTYAPGVVVFFLILTPVMSYRIEVTGSDGIFLRASDESIRILSDSGVQDTNSIIAGLELFTKYLGWVMLPNFIVFVPYGIIRFFRRRTRDTNFIIVFLTVSSLPILYAYFVQAQDTRYLYVLYPVFCLLALFAVEHYLTKLPRKNIVIGIMIIGILIGSLVFYEYKKTDYEKERELNEIAIIVSKTASGLNFHPSDTRYIRAAELPEEWPFVFHDKTFKIKSIPTTGHTSLESFIESSRGELTHLLVDNDSRLPSFLQEVYNNEENYGYLNKVFDSRDEGFTHHMMLFEINFEKFDSISK